MFCVHITYNGLAFLREDRMGWRTNGSLDGPNPLYSRGSFNTSP